MDDLENKIRTLTDKIVDVLGSMPTCDCRCPLDPSEPFCTRCGNGNPHFEPKSMKEELGCDTFEEARSKYCPGIHGLPLEPKTPYCSICGADLRRKK